MTLCFYAYTCVSVNMMSVSIWASKIRDVSPRIWECPDINSPMFVLFVSLFLISGCHPIKSYFVSSQDGLQTVLHNILLSILPPSHNTRILELPLTRSNKLLLRRNLRISIHQPFPNPQPNSLIRQHNLRALRLRKHHILPRNILSPRVPISVHETQCSSIFSNNTIRHQEN